MNSEQFLTPEVAFKGAVDARKKAFDAYETPSYIDNKGVYWSRKSFDPNLDVGVAPFKTRALFNPDAYDPGRPYEPAGKLWVPPGNTEGLIEDPFDLDNLRIMDKAEVENLLYKLEDFAYSADQKRKIVCMIAMGGTIAMKKDEKGEYVPGLDAEQLLHIAGGGIEEEFLVGTINFPTLIDSSQQEMDYNAELVIGMSYIWKNASEKLKERLSGFVIAHGTDTMAPSSAYTAMMLGPSVPFPTVFVGAQKTPENHLLSDVPTNIQNAFKLVGELKDKDVNATVVYAGGTSGGAYAAIAVEKRSDTSVMAFHSPTHPLVYNAETFGGEGINMDWFPQIKEDNEFKPVVLRGYAPIRELHPQMGDDPAKTYLDIANDDKSVAVLVTTFGSFTVNNKMRKAVAEACEVSARPKVIFAANPFPEGSTDHRYQVAAELRRSGVNAINIPPTATRVKLTLANALHGDNLQEVANFMTRRNVIGEHVPRPNDPRWKGLLPGIPMELTKSFAEGKIRKPRVMKRPSLD